MNEIKVNTIGTLAEKYSKRPVLRALLSIVPSWGAADTLLQQRAEEIRVERLRTFFDELGEGEVELTERLIESDEFLHCFHEATKAAISTRRKEKIRMFARLLNSTATPGVFNDIDDFEELLNILESISFREFRALCILKRYEIASMDKEFENEIKRLRSYWNSFKDECCQDIKLNIDEFDSFMARLERSGLYQKNTELIMGYELDMGNTSPLFSRLLKIVENRGNA